MYAVVVFPLLLLLSLLWIHYFHRVDMKSTKHRFTSYYSVCLFVCFYTHSMRFSLKLGKTFERNEQWMSFDDIFSTHIQKHQSPSNVVINALWHNVYFYVVVCFFSVFFISITIFSALSTCVLVLRKSNNPDRNLTCAYIYSI